MSDSFKWGYGWIKHYNNDGKEIGSSHDSIDGITKHYDKYGKEVGESVEFGEGWIKHYDKYGKEIGESRDIGYGRVRNYDKNGRELGESWGWGEGQIRHYDRNGKECDNFIFSNNLNTNNKKSNKDDIRDIEFKSYSIESNNEYNDKSKSDLNYNLYNNTLEEEDDYWDEWDDYWYYFNNLD